MRSCAFERVSDARVRIIDQHSLVEAPETVEGQQEAVDRVGEEVDDEPAYELPLTLEEEDDALKSVGLLTGEDKGVQQGSEQEVKLQERTHGCQHDEGNGGDGGLASGDFDDEVDLE
jgi:hypothetical protein